MEKLLKHTFPCCKKQHRQVEFEIRIYDAGEHQLAIGSTPYQTIKIEGDKPSVVYEDFKLSGDRLLKGEKIKASAIAENLTSTPQKINANLLMDQSKIESQTD